MPETDTHVRMPFHVVWLATNACNARCQHCSSASERRLPSELTTEESFQLLNQLRDAGVLDLAISGGEPLLRADLYEIIAFAKALEFAVGVGSNGSSVTRESVHRLVDAEDLRQPGDPEDPQYPLPRADQIQRAVVRPHPLQAPDQHPEAGGVEELHLVHVDDELVVVLADQIDEQLTEPRRGIDIDLAPAVDDLDAVLVVVTQLQIHESSSAMHSLISTSSPANGPA